MLLKALIVLFISIYTNGLNNYYGQYGNNYNGGYGTSMNFNPFAQSNYGYGNEKVKIQLYYEALCPACKHFDTHDFKQTVLELAPYLDVDMHPYGNAKTIDKGYGNYEFVSQHGPLETYGDKLHACAINILQNTTTAVLFNSCLMDSSHSDGGSSDAASDVCGSLLYINAEPIKQCAKSNIGSQLLKYHGDASKLAGFKTVPTVLVNGLPVGCDHFKETVCRAFRNPPPECRY